MNPEQGAAAALAQGGFDRILPMDMGTAITCEVAGQPEPQETGLRELLAAIASRDQAALARFYDQTIGRVYGIALRITRRSEAAEEVAEDVYLQVWREAGSGAARCSRGFLRSRAAARSIICAARTAQFPKQSQSAIWNSAQRAIRRICYWRWSDPRSCMAQFRGLLHWTGNLLLSRFSAGSPMKRSHGIARCRSAR